ncbi:phosphatase [Butyrivibrio sp. VCB2006]|uniref:phosphatase n=1 Tax=Butyrivibrio sp. VCB2006 TaxID=1280679 RepID=UPI00040FE556|nr:phosphatase [Butyrivibrio sp. VCB2006]
MYQIECDTHTHTLYSRHAYSTIEENVRAARDCGIKLLASTDHFSDMLFGDYENVKNYQYFFCSSNWPRQWNDVMVLRGCEADIVDMEGHFFGHDIAVEKSVVGDPYDPERNLQELVFERLDFVIASVHAKRHTEGKSVAENTKMYIKALENPKVFFIGHIGRAGVPFDMDEVLLRAKELNKAVEINEHSFFWEGHHQMVCRDIAVRCAELGVSICVNTDAHMSLEIGQTQKAQAVLEEVGFPQELIINRTKESFLEGLSKSGVCNVQIMG